MSFVGNALVAKIRSMYAECLQPEDYHELLRKHSIYDVAVFLKKHPEYKEILATVSEGSLNRSRLEGLIRRNRFNRMLKLMQFVTLKDQSYYHLCLIRMEHETILAVIRGFISPDEYDVVEQIPYYLDRYSDLDFMALTKATDFKTLTAALAGTRYEKMIKPYSAIKNEDIRYYEFEALFEADYYRYAFDKIKQNYRGKLRKDLEDAFKARIEMENMIKVYRLKKYYGVKNEEIKSMLIPTTRISERKLDEIIAVKDPSEIYRKIVAAGVGPYTGDNGQVYLEYFGDHMRYLIARKFMYFSTQSPKVYQAFAFFSELEVQNLTHIIEGIRYQISEDEIRSMLVF